MPESDINDSNKNGNGSNNSTANNDNNKVPEPRLLLRYREEVVPGLMEKFGYKNRMAVPRLCKIVLNMGAGEAAHNQDILDQITRDLALISGQKPKLCRARKPISNFKIKKGNPVGVKVTLRSKMMYEFLDRFITFSVPRIRDFRGFALTGFDSEGNYNFGLNEYTIFPEVNLDKVKFPQGLNITINIKGGSPEESLALLGELGFPFKRVKQKG